MVAKKTKKYWNLKLIVQLSTTALVQPQSSTTTHNDKTQSPKVLLCIILKYSELFNMRKSRATYMHVHNLSQSLMWFVLVGVKNTSGSNDGPSKNSVCHSYGMS
jgi:hypothetical protein